MTAAPPPSGGRDKLVCWFGLGSREGIFSFFMDARSWLETDPEICAVPGMEPERVALESDSGSE